MRSVEQQDIVHAVHALALWSRAGYTNYLLLLQQHTHRLPSMTTVLGAVQAEVKKMKYEMK